MLRLLVAIAFAVNGAVALAQSSLLLASFNVESDADTQAELVAADMVRLSPLHIWALQEVADQETLDVFVQALTDATGHRYAGYLGESGAHYEDRLAYVYLAEAFVDARFEELDVVGGSRLPLLMEATTWTGERVTFINAHFNRGDAATREGQARRLREWIGDNPERAIIALGVFNFDYVFYGARRGGNRAFVNLARGGLITWPEPMCIQRENCPRTGSQCHPAYENILDFIFFGGAAIQWPAVTDLAFLDEAYCRRDADGYSDHRPVVAQIVLPAPVEPAR